MRVVFLEDVANVAKAGEIKEVAEGYGRNYLLPKKLAALATSLMMDQVRARQEAYAAWQARSEQELAELASKVEGKELVLKAKAGTKGRLYGAVTSADIAREFKKHFDIVIDKRDIDLGKPLRQLGNYEVTVKLTKDLTPKFKLSVEREG